MSTCDPGNILITGDSLTQEFALTFNKMLDSCLGGHVNCPNPADSFYVIYIRNDALYFGNGSGPCADASSCQNFISLLEKGLLNKNGSPRLTIGTVIMNRGAHYTPDEDFSTGVAGLFERLRLNRKDLSIYYRNTPAGHPGCGTPATKVTARPLEAALDLSTVMGVVAGDHNKFGDAHPYHWQDFARQNDLARKLASKYRVSFLDVSDATALRQVLACFMSLRARGGAE